MITKVAIQGIKGSFHDQVTREFYRNSPKLIECLTFDHLVDSIVKGNADQAVMAIENSIAGSIIPNYALIDKNNLVIVGEHYLSIQHNLMALEGQSINDIQEVYSHPMALLQCKNFFHKYSHIKLVETNDTADEVKKISENKIIARGAIAGATAAKIYGLNILSKSIQTIKQNVTRFVIIQKNLFKPQKKINKAGWKFVLDHKRGSLAAALNVMSDCNLNLTKIQSLPVIDSPGKYAFFVDVTFKNAKDYFKAKALIEIMANSFKILGEYESGK